MRAHIVREVNCRTTCAESCQALAQWFATNDLCQPFKASASKSLIEHVNAYSDTLGNKAVL
jgi:hypothetical protein